jgi:hypothetical protein
MAELLRWNCISIHEHDYFLEDNVAIVSTAYRIRILGIDHFDKDVNNYKKIWKTFIST